MFCAQTFNKRGYCGESGCIGHVFLRFCGEVYRHGTTVRKRKQGVTLCAECTLCGRMRGGQVIAEKYDIGWLIVSRLREIVGMAGRVVFLCVVSGLNVLGSFVKETCVFLCDSAALEHGLTLFFDVSGERRHIIGCEGAHSGILIFADENKFFAAACDIRKRFVVFTSAIYHDIIDVIFIFNRIVRQRIIICRINFRQDGGARAGDAIDSGTGSRCRISAEYDRSAKQYTSEKYGCNLYPFGNFSEVHHRIQPFFY